MTKNIRNFAFTAIILFAAAFAFILSSKTVHAASCTSHSYKLIASSTNSSTGDVTKIYRCTTCKGTKRVVSNKADKTYTIKLAGSKTVKVTGHYVDTMANQIVSQLNTYRKSKGLSTLKKTTALTKAAKVRAYEIGYKFSHTRPNGKACYTVNSKVVYGENIASGYTTAAKAMAAWKASAGHNANMLNSYKTVGVSVFAMKVTKGNNSTYVYYAVQNFGY